VTEDPLWLAIRLANERLSPDGLAEFPPPPRWEPSPEPVGTEIRQPFSLLSDPVPAAPTVPNSESEKCCAKRREREAALQMDREERAAILEYCCGLTRVEAEARAAKELGFWDHKERSA
jgi:hypothetical protein